MNAPDLPPLQRLAARAPSLEVQVLACMLAESQRVGARPLIRGLSAASFAVLCATTLAGIDLDNSGQAQSTTFDEFEELYQLLMEYATPADRMAKWLAAAIASAAQRDNHLWQDLGLPSRTELNAILRQRFPGLVAANSADMKWKKFFYRQLCERAGVPICKSPNCTDCVDHPVCFGPEN
ncbi:MAG: hydrogenase [Candidatus Dactylopiibacterium carminicum]|uniref:Hydrogenase n=1 Tax=Candidatus Dactylopiibacterium carminicum TaxID=857335 RepID=A0A272EY30_9RHOO|nr:nitrogen fixation protein NifQ [Candidatus Dactylopiibacterium carminicum]KAF7600407.1 hydrogenase [Candidatus Dactylopiibacterium carminicum]PAS95028.1 MAG: hydrogenase [Candidatus Dactylopiibacterium carminicum]PAS97863.1 MAG: hydrogenase [Candidatus Dactylopiibacterium carminicum]PAT00408.1 MAG: hypothetical protein BSR46_02380 [Candidatus Dactylopiibacterium carminicum]